MTTVLPQSSGIDRTQTVKVDIKKVDYTTRDWNDTDELKEEIRDYHPEAEEIIQTIDQHGAGLRPVIHILGRTSGGTRVHLRVHGVKPYFYMPHDKFKSSDVKDDKRVTGTQKGHYGINGKHMVKVYGRIPGDIGGRNSLRNDYAPDSHHEGDILFPNRFLIDSGIEGAVEIPSFHATPEPTDIPQYDLEPTQHSVSTRMCFCDIEVDDKDGFPSPDRAEREVTCITVYDDYVEDYIVFLYHPELPDVHHDEAKVKIYDDESRMMRAFNKYIVNRDFDAITGWNFSDFDARYLVNRLDVLEDDEDAIDVDKNDLSKFGSAYDDGYFGAKIKGMAVVDMLRAYQNLQFSDLDSYSLEDVAQEELGTGKIKDNRDLYVLWENEPQKLVDYNFKDVELTVKLEQKQNIIKFYEEIANYVGGRLAEVVDASKAVDVKVLRAVHGEWAVPSSGNVETEEFEGAKVFDPISGVKDTVIVLDLKSLYPMSMKTMNAGPETKDEDGELVAPNGIRFNNDEDAVVVEIIDEMLEERQKYKDLRNAEPAGSSKYKIYDRKQSAVKVVMNCFSGDTDVLTPHGIRNITELEVGDNVYSINPDNGKIEIKPVTDTIKQKNQYGKLKHIQTNNTDLKITPNHRMVVENGSDITIRHFDELPRGKTHKIPNHAPINGEKVEKRNILDSASGRLWIDISVHGNSFKSSCPWEIKKHLEYSKSRTQYKLDNLSIWDSIKNTVGHMIDNVGIQYDDKHSTIPIEYDMDDWLELLGWVISEGSFNSVDEKQTDTVSYRGNSDRVQIAQNRTSHRTRIINLVDRMGLNYSTDKNGVYIYNSNIYNILKDAVGDKSSNKQIPEWVFERGLPHTQLKFLLTALIDGDGDSTGDGTFRYSTNSEQLKEDVMKLATLCGYKVSSSCDSGAYRIYLNNNQGSFKVEQRTDTIKHNGYVHCVKIEDNHTLLAGRNGKFQWTGNTLYGVMGWDRFRLQDREVGAAVTAVGREVIKFTEEVVEDMGYQSVYGDTDSVMIQIDEFDESIIADKNARQRVLDKHDVNTFDELRAKIEDQRGEMDDDEFDKLKFTLIIGFEMEERINERYDDFAKDELNADEHYFQIEFEKLYKKFFQSGKKKRYAGLINWKEGKFVDKVDNVGFETNRSDYSKAAKEIISDTIEMILRGANLDDLHDKLSSKLSALKNEEVDPDEFGIPAAVTKNFDEYDNETVAVKGSRYANNNFDAGIQPGDKPKMHYVKRILPDGNGISQYPMPDRNRDRKQVCCWMNYRDIPDVIEWDWEEYIEAQIQGPLERIFSGTGWSWSEVVTGNRQPGLGEFSLDNEASDEDANVMELNSDSHTDNGGGDSTLDSDFDDDSETTEAEARNQLSNAQKMLDGLDGDDAENEIKMDAVELDDGPTSLDDFM